MRPEWPNSGTIVIPKDPRISQVLVRLNHSGSRATPIHRLENPHPYAQDATYLPGMTNPVNQQHRPIQQHNQPAIFKEGLDEVTVTPADIQSLQGPSNRHPEPKQPSNHAHFVLNVPSQGESLSEMILKVSEPGQTPLMHNPTSTARPVHNTSTLNDEALTSNARNTRNGAPSLPTDTPNPARVKSTATKASLTLSSDSSLSGLSAISNESSFECDEAEHTVTSAENTSFSTNQKAQRRNFGVSPLAILSEPEIEHYEAFMPQTEPHEPSYIFQRPNEVTRSRREAMTQAPLWKTNTKNRSDDVQELAPKSVLSSMGETMSSEVNSMSEPCPRIQPNSSYLGQAIPASTTASTMSVNSRALQDPEEAAIAFTMETNEPSHPPATISIQYLTITPSTSPVTSTPNSSAAKSGSELTSTLDTPASVAYTPTASTFTASTAPFPTPALSTPIPTPVPPPFYGRTPVIAHLQQIGAFDAFPERSYTPASSSTNRASHRHDSKPNFNPPSPLQAYHQRLENDPYISHRMKGSFRVMSPSNTSAPFEFPLSPTATTAAPAPTSFSTSTSPLPLVSLPTPSVQVTEPEDDPLPLAITDNRQETNIPMIVIHPDPDDQKEGESPRVLSNEDIEYLSMMPPPPLRLLEQPWDDSFEDEEYMDDIEEEYSDEDHEHRIVRSRSVYDIEEEDTDREESDDDQTMLVSMEIDDQHRGIE
ncbi:hypothetical protein BGW38_002056 [Lunasporangiospora selenospora]|uniref:Uncharacterized protein n=1 Tax=Lunasporangiospora selenospora TaxID=979761 RepID=A0A9P6KI70_9FUNG|nr:hypothetical protein BGW38_002056 [Lunasporangiospora selenospora]